MNGNHQTIRTNVSSFPNPLTDAQDFAHLLQQLSAGIGKGDIKQREGWRDRQGQAHFVDYVEWHTVADLLDCLIPEWSHAVRDIVQVGNFVAVTVALTLNGVTREGVGTGAADTETGIKKAEHDALKRAAVKFGIARDLYRNDDKQNEASPPASSHHAPSFNPLAQSRNDMISPSQLSLINKLAKSARLNPETVCQEMYKATLSEISRRAASHLIEYLQTFSPRQY